MTPVALSPVAIFAEVVPLASIPVSWDDAWDKLVACACEPNPFYERWFLRAAITHLGTNTGDRMIGVWQGDDLLGMLPVTMASRYGRMPVRHAENWVHFHCFYGAPLIKAGHEARFWHVVLDTLDRADWAPGFLHLVGLDRSGRACAALMEARRTDIVHRSRRALLASSLLSGAYYETHVRKKKRKEIARLRSRLSEIGPVTCLRLAPLDTVDPWIRDFLALERSGWKGREGSALGATPGTNAFFTDAISHAHASGRVEILKLSVGEKPIAMLVNFLSQPGSFSFKIAFDENYARFSPGVLIQIENLAILEHDGIEWMDSCAVEDHPMIDSLWAERREMVRVTIPLAGAWRATAFRTVRAIETLAARVRGGRR